MANNSLKILTNRFFALFLKSPIQMGWLSIINSVTNISRLGTFNVVFTGHFCLGWWSNYVGSESGQKQSLKLLQNMVYSTIQHPPSPPPLPQTVCIYCLVWEGGGGGEVREKVEGQQYTSIVPSSMGATVHKLGRKYQPWLNVSPVYKIC